MGWLNTLPCLLWVAIVWARLVKVWEQWATVSSMPARVSEVTIGNTCSPQTGGVLPVWWALPLGVWLSWRRGLLLEGMSRLWGWISTVDPLSPRLQPILALSAPITTHAAKLHQRYLRHFNTAAIFHVLERRVLRKPCCSLSFHAISFSSLSFSNQ